MVNQQVKVVGLSDLAKLVAFGRTDQRGQTRPTLILGLGVGNLLRQRLIGVLAALIVGLLGAQVGIEVFIGGEQTLQLAQCAVQLLGVKVAITLRLMALQTLFALVQQDLGLLDGFFTVLQALAQLADVFIVDAQ